ncbi:hypothetical protein WGT02_39755 (plasmid) [Rhizobium sp. T1470]|uniref:hypothetical protein n=1 Tax=Rhizobium sp. T1470 TaxID=555320 RepID=UPI001CD2CA0C|nr:hypothetical protein [Rhizobium sp. T1473]MCA0804328.1 hypothetical protein [Rhizobium sp. T1473]
MAGFYSARGRTIPPLPWPVFALPLSFFNRVPKAIGIAAVQEVGGNEEVCKGMEKDTKADAVTTTLHILRGTNWLPQPLRLRAVEPVDDVEQEQEEAGDIAAE